MSTLAEEPAQTPADRFKLSAILEPLVKERVDACMDAYVTKDYLNAVVTKTENRLLEEVSDFRKEVSKEIGDVRKEVNDLRKEVGDVRKEVNDLRKEVGDVRKEVSDFRKEVSKEIGDVRKEVNDLRKEIGSVNGNIAESYVKLSDKINKTSYTLLFAAAALLAVFSTLPSAIKELVEAISKAAGS